MSSEPRVRIIGGGLGGSEAAWQLARFGVPVLLEEMRPVRPTPAHQTDRLAEVVCSNSFKSNDLHTASGVLKEELRLLGSLLISIADRCRVPAGQALAIDRELFAAGVTEALEAEPLITIERREAVDLDGPLPIIMATGPLTSGPLSQALASVTGEDNLHFYDAIAPIIVADSIDRSVAWAQSRYDKGEGVYLNCPLDEEQYRRFVAEVKEASAIQLKDFEKSEFFEACLPIEETARRGDDTLAFGPMKPVGLTDPRTGERAHAVVQLRQDDVAAEHYGMVGFQTNLRFPEQERIFRTIPGLEKAVFARLGQMHRNAYVDPPAVLHASGRTRKRRDLFIAGQLCGVEGYVESVASGLLAAWNIAIDLGVVPESARPSSGEDLVPPEITMIGALQRYVTNADRHDRQPMNAAFGLMPTLPPTPDGKKRKRRQRNEAQSERALTAMTEWATTHRPPAVMTDAG
ncbi:MAG: methylenetetrahydrofolate--tRNA-(uracil(54)-C(5))-methyltransferase (FADH(2)-oxidizing) TrmFO [Acidobacteriota bacterium]